MANVSVRLRVKDGGRYPFLKPVTAGTRLKPGWAVLNGVPTQFADGSYYIRYTQCGKQVDEKVGFAADVQARKEAREYILNAPAGVTVVDEAKPEPKALAVDVVAIYLAEIKANKRPATYESYRHSLESFKRFWKRDLASITRADLLDFKTALKNTKAVTGQPLSGRTQYNRFNDLMMFLKWAQIKTDIRKGDWPVKPEREPDEYPDAELEKLFTTALDAERIVLKCFLNTGMRSGELAHLTNRDVDFVNSVWTVQSKLGWDGKTEAAQRHIPVDTGLTAKIAQRMADGSRTPSDLIFPNRKGEAFSSMLSIVKKVAARAGPTGIRVDDHKFRSTAITRWLREGNSVTDVMAWAGHRDMETIMRYAAKVNVGKPEVREKAAGAFKKFAAVGD